MALLKRLLFSGLLVSTIVTFSADNAHAYIDPGSGSYLLQFLVAGLLGGLFALKMYWKKMKLKISALFGKKDSEDSEPEL